MATIRFHFRFFCACVRARGKVITPTNEAQAIGEPNSSGCN
jgi:hypothetical protein